MAEFTCPTCSSHKFIAVPNGRGQTLGVCLGTVPYVPAPNAPVDLPPTRISCPFGWPSTDDALYITGG